MSKQPIFINTAPEMPTRYSDLESWKGSDSSFLSLPAELRENIYRKYLKNENRQFSFDRQGRRVFDPSDPAMPPLVLLSVRTQVRDELRALLYRESDLRVSVWPRQLRKMAFKNLAYDGNVELGAKIQLFRTIRISLGDIFDLVIKQSEDGRRLKAANLMVPLFADTLRLGRPQPGQELIAAHQKFGAFIAGWITDALQFISVASTKGFTPAVLERFVYYLVKLLLDASDEGWAKGTLAGDMEILRGEETLTSKDIDRAKKLLAVSMGQPQTVSMRFAN